MPLKEPLTQEDEVFLASQVQQLDPVLQIDLKMYLGQGLFAQAQDLLKKSRERTKTQLIGIKNLISFFNEKVK